MTEKFLSAAILAVFVLTPVASVYGEARTVDHGLPHPHSTAAVECSLSQEDPILTDDCFEAIVEGAFACVVAGKLTLGLSCWAAIYWIVGGCTCISTWGLIEYYGRLACWYFGPCDDLPPCSLAFDQTEECQEEYCGDGDEGGGSGTS